MPENLPPPFSLVALHDRLIVERVDAAGQTPGGLFVPEPARERPSCGIVRAVGPGMAEFGGFVETTVKVGERVFFGRFAHDEIEHGDKTYLVLRERDVLAVVRA